jgi:hypothetical protein
MRADLLRRPARCGSLGRALRTLVLTTLFCGAALAAPRVDSIAEPADPLLGCGFRTIGEPPAGGRLVLHWHAGRGTMNVDGKSIALEVTAEPCRANCVAPGRSGIQVFRFRGSDGVQAALTTRVHCPRHAEACAGLFAERARLAVSSARGKALLHVRNEECDY